MLTQTFAFLEPLVAATRPGRLVLVRRFLLALARALRSDAESPGACAVAATVFGLPTSALVTASARGVDALDQFVARALAERLDSAPEGLQARADWLVRWGTLVEALIPEGPHGASPVPDMVSLSPDMAVLFARMTELARSPLPLLLEGQPGTGKESIARAIHEAQRAPLPFLTIDAAQVEPSDCRRILFGSPLDPGLITRAGEGTLFIRNAESLPPAVQHQLARSLELSSVVNSDGTARSQWRCRFIVAVSEGALDAAGPGLGTLQPDFAYRVSTLYARLPPLVERGEDLAALYRNVVRRFVLRRAQPLSADEVGIEPRMTLTPRALMALYAYNWPGNVLEFVAVVRESRQRAGAGPVELSHLPERVVAALGRGGERPEDRLRHMLVEIAPASVSGQDQVAVARRRLRRWRDDQLDVVLDRTTIDLVSRSIAAFNALREGQHDPLPLDQILVQVRAAAAREVLLPMGANVPLFWEERAELVAELDAVAAAHTMSGAIARRLFDLGRALVLFRQEAIAQLTPGTSGDQRASPIALALLSASAER